VRHVGEELGLVLRRERELLGLFLERLARLLDLLVLALDLLVLVREQPRLLLQLLVGLLQLLLAALQLLGERLRLRQQVLGARVRLDRVDDDADRLGQLARNASWTGLKRCSDASSSTPRTSSSKTTGRTMTSIAAFSEGPRRSGTPPTARW
jgi:hypothetical protein